MTTREPVAVPVILGDAPLQRVLLGPGPSEVPARVLAALAGASSTRRNVTLFLGGLETLLRDAGWGLPPGAALEAAAESFAVSDATSNV